MKVIARGPDPEQGGMTNEHDITEAVQVMYDIIHSSMDWGSGMLDTEEMTVVIELAILMGWQVPEMGGPFGTYGLPCDQVAHPMVTLALKYPDHYELVPYRPDDYPASFDVKVRKP